VVPGKLVGDLGSEIGWEEVDLPHMKTALARKSSGASCWSERTDSLVEVGLSPEALGQLRTAVLAVGSIVALLGRVRIC